MASRGTIALQQLLLPRARIEDEAARRMMFMSHACSLIHSIGAAIISLDPFSCR